jgi:RNA polymerase sigma factor for flagellar operon FliA
MMKTQLYEETGSLDKEALVTSHLPLIHFLVERMVTQVPSYVTRDEIRSAAMVGLVDAANRYDPDRGVLFKTFAERRVRGAVFDEVRRMDWFSRSQREKHARLCRAVDRLEKRLGRSPEEEEIALELGLSLEDYHELLNEVSHLGCVSLNEAIDDSDSGRCMIDNLEDENAVTPLGNLESLELRREMAEHLRRLSEKERLVVAMYYYEELNQKEISEVLSISEGRVSQLHSQALLKLKVRLSRRVQMPAYPEN